MNKCIFELMDYMQAPKWVFQSDVVVGETNTIEVPQQVNSVKVRKIYVGRTCGGNEETWRCKKSASLEADHKKVTFQE